MSSSGSSTSSEPPSPGVAPADGDELPDQKCKDRVLLIYYQKKHYLVPKEHVVFDKSTPFPVASGEAAHKLHECKSYNVWNNAGIRPHHFVKIKFELRGKMMIGFYITFRVVGAESDDYRILRAVNKTISKKYCESVLQDDQFKELASDEPAEESQLSPVAMAYDVAPDPDTVLYERPKKRPREPESAKASSVRPSDDDDAEASTSSLHTPPSYAPCPAAAPALPTTGMTLYMQTPGLVTISEEYFKQLVANQRS